MRFLLKAEFPVEVGNAAMQDGSLGKTIRSILDDQEPEAAYFLASSGKRTACLFLDMQDASQIPKLAEPWFLAFHASVEIVPVMTADDLMKAEPAIEQAVKKYSGNLGGNPMPDKTARLPLREGKNMRPCIQKTEFGSITVDEEVLDHDIVIRLNGEVKKRKKKLSKKQYGTSHTVSLEEAEHIFDDGAERLIIGSGQDGNVQLSEEAASYFKEKGCSVELHPTPEAIQVWNAAEGKTIAMFHVTC